MFAESMFLTVAHTAVVDEDREPDAPAKAGRASRGALDVFCPVCLRSLFAINRSYFAS
jgi:hypothetical protein